MAVLVPPLPATYPNVVAGLGTYINPVPRYPPREKTRRVGFVLGGGGNRVARSIPLCCYSWSRIATVLVARIIPSGSFLAGGMLHKAVRDCAQPAPDLLKTNGNRKSPACVCGLWQPPLPASVPSNISWTARRP